MAIIATPLHPCRSHDSAPANHLPARWQRIHNTTIRSHFLCRFNPSPFGQISTIAVAGAAVPSGSDHHHYHHHLGAASSSSPSSPSPDVLPPLSTVKNTMLLKAANVAHFDAPSHDFDKHHLDAAAVSDRLSCVLHCIVTFHGLIFFFYAYQSVPIM